MNYFLLLSFFLLSFSNLKATPSSNTMPNKADMRKIGNCIWRNECAGTVSGLTSWNQGEEFPSLGITHCIWYPYGKRDRFEESWPKMAHYLQAHGIILESWMFQSCPWPTRSSFMADFKGPRLIRLRSLLADSIDLQASYAAQRLQKALPKILQGLSPAMAAHVKTNFERMTQVKWGFYALIDYVNFKGEGILSSEQYHGQGWGLLQVLEVMPTDGAPLPGFVQAAKTVLKRRVENAPLARHEKQWLPGWNNRLKTYLIVK